MYLAYLSFSYCAKNNLEKAILAYLDKIDRTIIQDKDLPKFKSAIIENIEGLCRKYKKCKRKNPAFLKHGLKDKDFNLDGIDCAAFRIYFSSQEYREGVVCLNLFENTAS